MSRLFNSISIPFKKRNPFDLSFESRLSTDFGRLTPILCEPVLPNDRFQIKTNLRVDFAPMKFPVMQKFTAYIHYFFVPNRLLWSDWEDFITGGPDGLADPSYPTIALTSFFSAFSRYVDDSSLADYLNFPSLTDSIASVFTDEDIHKVNQFDALPFKAYQLIYNEWYRDQNLSDEVDIYKDQTDVLDPDDNDEGPIVMGLMELRQRAWRKDYFTSALPDPQRGPDVTLPLLGDLSVDISGKAGSEVRFLGDGVVNMDHDDFEDSIIAHSSGGDWHFLAPGSGNDGSAFSNGDQLGISGSIGSSDVASVLQADANLADSENTVRSATINEVRRAFAVQRWYELAARAGSRYVEQILAHFGIRSSDARLQRPEYIGGAAIPVFIGDVLQTSETNDTPLGTPAGVGQAGGFAKMKRRTFEEHGWLLGILSIIPEASYFQGMPRKYLKRKKFDFAWPLLANLGEQEIEKQELYFDASVAPSYQKEGFGYTPRYAEYKFGAGEVHGDFRSSLLDFHDARVFVQTPALNESFVKVTSTGNDLDAGLNRIFAVRGDGTFMTDHLWVHLYNNIKVRRVLPKYGTPI